MAQGNFCPVDDNSVPCRAYFFFIANEFDLQLNRVTRRHFTYASSQMQQMLAYRPMEVMRSVHPRAWGIQATGTEVIKRPGQHIFGEKPSPYTSVSTNKTFKKTRFTGQNIIIDVNRLKASGAKTLTRADLLRDLSEMRAMPEFAHQLDRIIQAEAYVSSDAESLIEGFIPRECIKNLSDFRITRVMQTLSVVSVVLTTYNLVKAGIISQQQHTFRPLVHTALRETGGWAGAAAGAKVGTLAAGVAGIETGPGDILIAGVGGVAGGFLGYGAPDWLYYHIPPKFQHYLDK